MSDHNPYQDWVSGFVRLLEQGRAIAARSRPAPPPGPVPGAPQALIFAPHPDDEAIIGGLPLRLARQGGWRITDVAVTLGSRQARRTARRRELTDACAYLGFGLRVLGEDGLEAINPTARQERPGQWAASVETVAGVLAAERPAMIFLPHAGDWNRTHLGVHLLVMEALARQPGAFACQVVETEFWSPMDDPNLLVESSVEEVAELVAALSLHTGEVARNPYHLRLPAWMVDNVRRGGELVGGQGAAAPNFPFATLYRLRHWRGGRLRPVLKAGRVLARGDDLNTLFPQSILTDAES